MEDVQTGPGLLLDGGGGELRGSGLAQYTWLQLILFILGSLQQGRAPFVDSGKKAASAR